MEFRMWKQTFNQARWTLKSQAYPSLSIPHGKLKFLSFAFQSLLVPLGL